MKVYIVVEEFYDYWCPQDNEGGWDDIHVFSSKELAEEFIREKSKTKKEDDRAYIMLYKDMGL